MNDSIDLAYQAARFGFAFSLLLFLLLLVRGLVRDIADRSENEFPAPPARFGRATLTVIDGAESQLARGDVFQFERRIVVGRSPDCDLQIDDPSVSGTHAALYYERDTWFVQDFGTTNGTYRSGKPVLDRVEVENGDTLQFGRVVARLMC